VREILTECEESGAEQQDAARNPFQDLPSAECSAAVYEQVPPSETLLFQKLQSGYICVYYKLKQRKVQEISGNFVKTYKQHSDLRGIFAWAE